jgi:hypothetical protein
MPVRPFLLQMAAVVALLSGRVPQTQSNGEAAQKTTKTEFRCSLPQDFRIVRIDERSKRLFLEGTEADVAPQRKIDAFLQKLDRAIGTCEPSWKISWSVSFFADPRLTGYKTDFSGVEVIAWAKAYIAEYDRSTEVLTVRPLDTTKRRTRRVIVDR